MNASGQSSAAADNSASYFLSFALFSSSHDSTNKVLLGDGAIHNPAKNCRTETTGDLGRYMRYSMPIPHSCPRLSSCCGDHISSRSVGENFPGELAFM
jgi:hypothetical protein